MTWIDLANLLKEHFLFGGLSNRLVASLCSKDRDPSCTLWISLNLMWSLQKRGNEMITLWKVTHIFWESVVEEKWDDNVCLLPWQSLAKQTGEWLTLHLLVISQWVISNCLEWSFDHLQTASVVFSRIFKCMFVCIVYFGWKSIHV